MRSNTDTDTDTEIQSRNDPDPYSKGLELLYYIPGSVRAHRLSTRTDPPFLPPAPLDSEHKYTAFARSPSPSPSQSRFRSQFQSAASNSASRPYPDAPAPAPAADVPVIPPPRSQIADRWSSRRNVPVPVTAAPAATEAAGGKYSIGEGDTSKNVGRSTTGRCSRTGLGATHRDVAIVFVFFNQADGEEEEREEGEEEERGRGRVSVRGHHADRRASRISISSRPADPWSSIGDTGDIDIDIDVGMGVVNARLRKGWFSGKPIPRPTGSALDRGLRRSS